MNNKNMGLKNNNKNPLAPLAPTLNNVVSALTGSQNGSSKKSKGRRQKKNSVAPDRNRYASAPAAQTTVVSSAPRSKEQPYVIVRREYLQDINASSAFTVTELAINPGLVQTFPWLSQTANAYDIYKFRRLRFCYMNRDTSADKGSVAIAFDPNPDDPAPTTQQQIDNFDTRAVTTPWADACFDVPPYDLGRLKKFLVRDSLVAAELATYDLGSLFIATSGQTGTGKIGELWVEYEVQFSAPQPFASSLALPIPESNSTYRQTAPFTVTGGTTGVAVPWDTPGPNPLGLLPDAQGRFTGIRGSLVVYAQMTITPAAQITGGGITIQTSTDGVNWVGNMLAVWPQGVTATSQISQNVETVLQLLSTSYFRIVLTTLGNNAQAVPGGPTFGILVLTPA